MVLPLWSESQSRLLPEGGAEVEAETEAEAEAEEDGGDAGDAAATSNHGNEG